MRIINKKIEPDASGVYVGRPTAFGNPFNIGVDGTRDQVCDLFAAWVMQPEQSQLRAQIREELYGNDLICFCHPQRCHAETLRRIALSASDDQLLNARSVSTDGL